MRREIAQAGFTECLSFILVSLNRLVCSLIDSFPDLIRFGLIISKFIFFNVYNC